MIVNKRVLSDVLGVSERSLTDWQKQGLPIEFSAIRGAENEYDTAKVIKWMIAKELAKIQLQSPKERLDSLRADEVELRLAERAGQLLIASDVQTLWSTVIATTRMELESFVDGIDSKVRAAGVDADKLNLRESLVDLLGRLETMELPDVDESYSDSEPSADAEEFD